MISIRTLLKDQHQATSNSYRYFWLFLIFSTSSTQASFTDSLTIGNAKAVSLGHAVTADPPGIDSVHFNPAGLTELKGRQFHLKGVYGIFEMEMEMGEYGEYQQNLIDNWVNDPNHSSYFVDGNGNLTPAGQAFIYDEAHNAKSEVEGPTIMLPGTGMVDLPFAGGVMGGASYTPTGSRFTFATNVYAPMMNGLHRAKDDPGRYAQERVAFTVITYFSPSIAYELTDELSIGLAVTFNYAGMGMELPAREPHAGIFFLGSSWTQDNFCNGKPAGNDPSDPDTNICTTVVNAYEEYANLSFEVEQLDALGYNLGLLWSPQPWLSLGVAYNSKINADMDGNFEFPVNDNFKTFLVGLMSGSTYSGAEQALGSALDLPTAEEIQNDAKGKMNVQYELPQHLAAGISVQILPRWKTNFDVKWTEWSAFSNINLNFGKSVGLLKLGGVVDTLLYNGENGITGNSVKYKLGLQDVTYWGMGTEYQYNDKLALRFGFEDRPSAVPEDRPNAFIPINDGKLYSAGFAYELKNDDHIDFALGYFNSKTHFPPCSADVGNGCNLNNVVYPVFQGQDLKTNVTFYLIELMYSRHF